MRKCGTCRHFSDCGVAGSGHCLHDHRRHLLDVVLVRKTELACRNTYDQDLWEPLAHRAGADASMEGASYRPLPEPEPPGIIAGSEEARPSPGLGLPGRLHLRPTRGAEPAEEQPQAPDLESQATGVISEHPGGAGVREARRRRQIMLEQEKRQEFAARTGVNLPEPTRRPGRTSPNWPTPPTLDVQPSIDAGGTRRAAEQAAGEAPSWPVLPPDVSVEFSGRRPTTQPQVPQPPSAPPVPPASSNRIMQGESAAAARAAATPPAQMERAPRRAAERPQPRTNRAQQPPQPPQGDAAGARSAASAGQQPRGRQAQAQVRAQAPATPKPKPQERSQVRAQGQVQPTEQFDVVPPAPRRAVTTPEPARGAAPVQPVPAPLPVPRTAVGERREAQPTDERRGGTEARAGRAAQGPVQGSQPGRPAVPQVRDVAAYGVQPASPTHYAPVNDEPLALPPRRQASSDLASARQHDPIDASARYAGVPRCCATCVSYQRGDGNARGHCHNVHVFTIPHPVDGDGLACRSSMGSWWLPASGVLAAQASQARGNGQTQGRRHIPLQVQHGPRTLERGRED